MRNAGKIRTRRPMIELPFYKAQSPNDDVRGVIVASEFAEDLKLAASLIQPDTRMAALRRLAIPRSLWYGIFKHPPLTAGLRSRRSAG
jgi:hypothetical protein